MAIARAYGPVGVWLPTGPYQQVARLSKADRQCTRSQGICCYPQSAAQTHIVHARRMPEGVMVRAAVTPARQLGDAERRPIGPPRPVPRVVQDDAALRVRCGTAVD